MSKKPFNVMDMMNASSKAAAGEAARFEERDIDIEDIVANPANAKIYSTENIGRLAESIELAGKVLQNLVVTDRGEDGKYMLISGHRRWMACQQLVSEGKEKFKTVHALIERVPDKRVEELLLIESNASSRNLTDAEKMRQAERTMQLCKELKEEQMLSGRVRDIAAQMLNMSASHIARLHAIHENLAEPLTERFENGSMSTSAAYEAQKLSEEEQHRLAEQTREKETVTMNDVAAARAPEPAADVSNLDTTEEDARSSYMYVGNEMMDMLARKRASGEASPCDLCTLGTGCAGCCKSCPDTDCGVQQPCQREAAYQSARAEAEERQKAFEAEHPDWYTKQDVSKSDTQEEPTEESEGLTDSEIRAYFIGLLPDVRRWIMGIRSVAKEEAKLDLQNGRPHDMHRNLMKASIFDALLHASIELEEDGTLYGKARLRFEEHLRKAKNGEEY